MGSSIGQTATPMTESFSRISYKDLAFTHGKTAAGIRGPGSETKCPGKEILSGRMDIDMKANTSRISNKDKGSSTGPMGRLMTEGGIEGSSTVLALSKLLMVS